MNMHGLLKLGIHIWSLSFSFSLSLLLSMLLSMSLSLLCTTQELFPRCEANQAGGKDQLVGVGRCQRDRLDQGAGVVIVIVMVLVTMVMVMSVV